jgi:predicted DNA binding CopG/RHH family protein
MTTTEPITRKWDFEIGSPQFKTEKDAARFWDAHRFEDYYKDTREAAIRFVKKPKKTVAIRMDPDDMKSVEAIAQHNGLSYTALLRMWIKEYLARERKRVA